MKLVSILISSFFVLYGASISAAEEEKFGVGFILGDPTAVSIKYFSSAESAYDLQASINGKDYFMVWADYLFHFPGYFGGASRLTKNLNSYVGIGPLGVIATEKDHPRGNYFDERDDDFAIGARVPFGVEWFMSRVPLAVGLELAPGVIVAPATKGIIQGGLSLRFYF